MSFAAASAAFAPFVPSGDDVEVDAAGFAAVESARSTKFCQP